MEIKHLQSQVELESSRCVGLDLQLEAQVSCRHVHEKQLACLLAIACMRCAGMKCTFGRACPHRSQVKVLQPLQGSGQVRLESRRTFSVSGRVQLASCRTPLATPLSATLATPPCSALTAALGLALVLVVVLVLVLLLPVSSGPSISRFALQPAPETRS
eukprot:354470-Chlamydomonas_euryale.AAC.6